MRNALQSLFGIVGGFFRWWFGELAALIPAVLRERFRSGGERLLLEIGSGEQRLYRLRGRKAILLNDGKLATGKAKVAVTLALPRAQIVTRPTQLPLAAEENLREVVGFEMDRLTPFSRDEVYYACRVTQRHAKAGRLMVEVMLAPRRKVDALLAGLRDQGLRITAVDVATSEPGCPLGINLLPQAAGPLPSRFGRVVAGALTAAAVVLLFVALQVPLQRKADYAAALHERVAAERVRVSELRRLEEEIAGLRTQDTSLHDLKRENALVLALVDQATRLLPDDAWLNQLSLNGDRLDLSGFSPSSSKLITVFEQSPLFTETVFRAPVTQDPRLGLERFSLSMRVMPEAGR
ncbi:MAG: PilN domain-containing protein [Kiloniellaceae bacterium]